MRVAVQRCAAPCLLDDGERRERLSQLFGDDYMSITDKEINRVSPTQQLDEQRYDAAASSDEDDELAGRRVRKQTKTSDLEQLLDIGARFDGLWTLIDGVRKGSLGSTIKPGRICIARRDLPSKYIVVDQAYEVRSIYYQGLRGAEVERVPVASADTPPPEGCKGYVMYMTIFSEEYHTVPVIVRPEEVCLVSLGEEVVDSLKIAVPILGFWLTVIAFLLAYGQQSASAANTDALLVTEAIPVAGVALVASLDPPRMGDFSGSVLDVMYNNFALEGGFLLLITLALVGAVLEDPKRN